MCVSDMCVMCVCVCVCVRARARVFVFRGWPFSER